MHKKITNPKVSVVMPIFKHSAEKLTTAISSILNQTFEDFEFIIIDGSSDDANFKIISTLKDSRIRYYRIKGYINCLNYGIKQSKGIYIARMDSDDIALPNRLEEQANFLDNNPDIALCSNLVEFFGAREDISLHKYDITLFNLIKIQEFVHPSMMFRKSLNIKFDNIKPLEDCLLFRKLLLKGHKFAIIDKVLLKNYVSNKSIMSKYPEYCKILMTKINNYSLAQYYDFKLSFINEIFNKKSYSEQEIIEYLHFVLFLKQNLDIEILNWKDICYPLFSYIISKTKNKTFLLKYKVFYKTFFTTYAKACLQFIFSITNKNIDNTKLKVICILGIKIRLKHAHSRTY